MRHVLAVTRLVGDLQPILGGQPTGGLDELRRQVQAGHHRTLACRAGSHRAGSSGQVKPLLTSPDPYAAH